MEPTASNGAGLRFFTTIGRWTIYLIIELGRMNIFLAESLYLTFRKPLRLRLIIKEVHFIGVKSLLVILLTATFSGMVLGLQGHHTLRQFGSEAMLGSGVALALIRELGPVLGALMVTARAGSAMAAELGIMRISEQIDALDVLTINSMKFLVLPKILAGIIAVPLLVGIFDLIGIGGGYLVGVKLLGVNKGSFFHNMYVSVVWKDVYSGFIKSVVFGAVLTWICCYKGYTCGHGAKGVGKATTEAVVISSVVILIADYFLTSILL